MLGPLESERGDGWMAEYNNQAAVEKNVFHEFSGRTTTTEFNMYDGEDMQKKEKNSLYYY